VVQKGSRGRSECTGVSGDVQCLPQVAGVPSRPVQVLLAGQGTQRRERIPVHRTEEGVRELDGVATARILER